MTSDVLLAALDFEKRGHDYYMDIASKASSPLTKAVFSALASEELAHMRRINELHAQTGSGEATCQSCMEEAVKDVFTRFTAQERAAWTMDNAEAYEYATNLEKDGMALYKQLAEESENPAEADFFRSLHGEESKHLEALQNVVNYLQHTGDWLAAEEGRVWNWMNT